MAKRHPKNKRSNSYDPELRGIIAWRITEGRNRVFPGRGGQGRCAREFGVSPQQWSQYESGHRTPEDQNLAEIAKHLKTTAKALMTPPENWDAVREERLAARSRGKKKTAETGRKETEVEKARSSLGITTSRIPSANESHAAAHAEPQGSSDSGYGSHSSKTMESIQKIINIDLLRAKGKISEENLANTLKSVDILLDALYREVTR